MIKKISKVTSIFVLGALLVSSLGIVPLALAVHNPAAAPETLPATNVTPTDATLNAETGNATSSENVFWVSLAPFTITSGTTSPSGVYSTPDVGPLNASVLFSAQLSSVDELPWATGTTTATTSPVTVYYAPLSLIDDEWHWGDVSTLEMVSTTTDTAIKNPITLPATNSTSSDPTLNGQTGQVDVDGARFWVSLYDFDVSTTSLSTTTPPSDVYETPLTGPLASSTNFSSPLSGAAGLPIATTSTTTTYYFSALNQVDGDWYAGAVLTFVRNTTATTTDGDMGGDVASLHVDSIEVVRGNALADGTFDSGWKYIFHLTVPTDQDQLTMRFSNWVSQSGSSTIAVANNMRFSSAQASTSTPVMITAPNTYPEPGLTLVADLSTVQAGRQVDVVVDVSIPVGSANGTYTTNYGVKSME